MRSSKRLRGVRDAAVYSCESLERRVLLCGLHMADYVAGSELPEYVPGPRAEGAPESDTGGLVWVNRGSASDDSDNFGATYGSLADAARTVVDAAFSYWNQIIVSFNQQGGHSQVDVTVMGNGRGTGWGGTGGVTSHLGGKPRTSQINLGGGGDVNEDGVVDDAEGFYIDSTPYNFVEFGSQVVNAFTGGGGPWGNDLFSLVTIELQHAVGVDTSDQLLWRQDPNNYIRTTGSTHANSLDDVVDTNGKLYYFNSPNVRALLTSNNGGPGGADFEYAVHTARPGNTFTTGGVTYTGQIDTGVASYAASTRYLPSRTAALMLQDIYGYTIAQPQTFGTFYSMPDPVNRRVLVRNPDPASNDVMEVRTSGLDIITAIDIGNDVPGTNMDGIFISRFSRLAFDTVIMDGGGGDDILRVDATDNMPVTVRGNAGNDTIEIGRIDRRLNLITGNVTVEGGSGTDTLIIWDELSTAGRVSNITSNSFSAAGSGVFSYIGIESMTFNAGSGNDSIRVASTNIPLTINGGAGDDILRPGFNEASGVHTLININANITFNGGLGPDSVILRNDHATNNWFHQVNNGSIVNLGPNGARTVFIPGVERVEIAAGSGNDYMFAAADTTYTYLFRGNDGNDIFDVRGGSSAMLFGGNGNDWFILGGGNLGPSITNATIDAGPGIDRMILDDSLSTHNGTWTIYGATGNAATNRKIFLEINEYSYVGFEEVEVRAGNGNNVFNLHSTAVPLILDGGGGNDSFVLHNFNNRLSDGFSIITHPVSINGGTGFDTITVNDQSRFITSYTLEAERFRSSELLVQGGADFGYANINSMAINASDEVTNLTVLGTPSSIPAGQQISFFGNAGNDTITIVPRDAEGNLTINGNLGINGGAGNDTIRINDTGSGLPIDYRFYNPFGPGGVTITGMGSAHVNVHSNVENIVVDAGGGSDTFRIDSFTSGNGLTINTGGGDDVIRFGNGSLSGNITSMSVFAVNGQGGNNRFYMDNTSAPGGWIYSRSNTHVSADNNAGYFVHAALSNVQHVEINAGAQPDTFFMNAVPAGTKLVLNGGAGLDVLSFAYFLGDAHVIRGPIHFNGEAGGGRIALFDGASVGRTVHLDANSLGAYPGDDLFGPGGAVYFTGLAHSDTQPGISLNLGHGADTIYAQPLAGARVAIHGNNPTTAPGDRLFLALAAAQNYSINPISATAGTVTSSNLQPLEWSGIETGPVVDDVAPSVIGSSFQYNAPQQAVAIQFGENVSAALGVQHLVLTNLTTGQQVPQSHLAVSYDSVTNTATFTFPGYGNGILPDGVYQAVLSDAVADVFGNKMVSAHQLGFFVLAGDATRDGVVNVSDLSVLAANWQGTGRTFSQGDFSYDGVVNVSDLSILAANWQKSLDLSPLLLMQAEVADAAVDEVLVDERVVEMKGRSASEGAGQRTGTVKGQAAGASPFSSVFSRVPLIDVRSEARGVDWLWSGDAEEEPLLK